MKNCILLILIFAVCIFGYHNNNSNELIVHTGVDTLSTQPYKGYFDFILQRPCTSQVDFESNEFKEHIRFSWDNPSVYVLNVSRVNYNCFKDFGKINLDSISIAPPDSELVADNGGGLFRVFNVTPDSLKSLTGNSYVIKSRIDPRYTHPFYAKFRIIKFDVKDSANHIMEMIFVWAMQTGGTKNLQTSNLDTFDIPVPIISNCNNCNLLSSNRFKSQTVFKTTSNRFVIPKELVGRVKFAEVYDLRGRMLKQLRITNYDDFVDLKGIRISNNVLLIRFTR